MRSRGAGLRTRHFVAALLVPALALLFSAGCEVAIGDAVPAFLCEADAGPSACPGSQVCSPASHQCVDMCSVSGCPHGFGCSDASQLCVPASTDGSTDEAAADARPNDAPLQADGGPCRSLGCKCSGDADCNSSLCLDMAAATTELYTAAGRSSFCGQTCCTSADCPGGTVCFATAAGGNYCVNPAWLGDRSTPGRLQGGSSCSTGTQCRSGLCAGGTCADPCCSTQSGQCASGSACAFGNFPGKGFDTHYSARCVTSPDAGAPFGSFCSADADCESNLCLNYCVAPCRNSADCPSGHSCWYVLPNSPNSNDVVAACLASTQGSTAVGQSCSSPASCANDLCVGGAGSMVCTDTCFVDSDCPSSLPNCALALLTVGMGGNVEATICQ